MIENFFNCVYQININKYKQIGSAKNLNDRIYLHKRALDKNIHWNKHLQNAYNKYKEFSFEILKVCENRQEAFNEEQLLLDLYYGKEDYTMQNP